MINHLSVHLKPDAIMHQGRGKMSLSSKTKETCAEYLKVDFEDSYSIEIRENKTGDTVVVLTAGGIHRVMDLQTLQHLVAMTY
jgi:hypothetical protein